MSPPLRRSHCQPKSCLVAGSPRKQRSGREPCGGGCSWSQFHPARPIHHEPQSWAPAPAPAPAPASKRHLSRGDHSSESGSPDDGPIDTDRLISVSRNGLSRSYIQVPAAGRHHKQMYGWGGPTARCSMGKRQRSTEKHAAPKVQLRPRAFLKRQTGRPLRARLAMPDPLPLRGFAGRSNLAGSREVSS